MDATALSVDTASPLLCARTVRPRSPAGLSAARAYRCMSSPAQISSVAALMVDRMLNRGACADEINGVALMALETPLPRGYVEARVAEREQQAAVKAALPPGITQRTPEWYAAREGFVTASDFHTAAFGTDAAKARFVKNKSGAGSPFGGSAATRWGVKYEDGARLLYEHYMCTKVHEYGLIPHPAVDIMAASPDGISDQGVAVEIKVPYSKTLADIPVEYYAQMQGQMEVCGLKLADFVVCKTEELDAGEFWPRFEEAYAIGYGFEKFGAIASKAEPDGALSFAHSAPGLSPAELRAFVDARLAKFDEVSLHYTLDLSVRRVPKDEAYVANMIDELHKTWELVLKARTEPPQTRAEKLSFVSPALKGFAFKNFSSA